MIRRFTDRIQAGESRENLMNYEWSRFDSFQNFPSEVPVSTLRLAADGFYFTGEGDKVKCYSCSFEHFSWREGDVPAEIHRRLSPTCEFVRGTDGSNVHIRDVSHGFGGQVEGISEDQRMDAIHGRNPGYRYPEFENKTSREASFQGWTNQVVDKNRLAEAGFYYAGANDYVRCFCCGGGLRGWEEGEDPWIEHARWFPWCRYLRDQKGDQFIQAHSTSDNNIASASHSNQLSVGPVPSQIKDKKGVGGRMNNAGVALNAEGGTGTGGDGADKGCLDDDLRKLQNENRKLKEMLTCKICMDNEPNIIFLPCSHLVTCEECAPHFKECPICRNNIKGRKKIFIA